ncbi:MAG: NAD(P)/FAD-dependent oxidoreductase [Candidatus Lokiarchaeota archaeon]|nr:NAD(P)/FAD-dependent oxidoreductase [Candidatus Lokiarchaeota archaeon]
MYDVIISGAGPAGSKCAEVIAKKGYKVALVERDASWRKPCGGAVSSRVFKYYPQLREKDFQKIHGINIYSADFHKLEYSWKGIREDSINVDRLEFDRILQNIAVDAGAEIFDKNLSYDFIINNGKKVGIKTKSGSGINEFHGKIIIVADGMSSKLAIKSGLRKKWKIDEIGLVKCAILEGETSLDCNFINIFFRPYIGYGWIFPLKDNRFNVGVGTWLEGNLNSNTNDLYYNFLREKEIRRLLHQNNYKEIWSASYPLPAQGVLGNSLFNDNLMIIGDAAGFVSPISGEGIHASIVSGFTAGSVASLALDNENISFKMLKEYKQNSNIKKIIKNFKMQSSLVNFFFENNGQNLSKMLELAENSSELREEVINMFLFNQAPSRDFLIKIK